MRSTEFVWSGAWLVATYKAFSQYDLYDSAFEQYEATLLVARAAQLLSSIRELDVVETKEFEVRRKLAKLKPSETPSLLKKLADLGVVDVEWTRPEQGEVRHVRACGSSRRWVFESAGKLFYKLDPTEQEQASLLALDLTVVSPLPETTLRNRLEKAGYSGGSASVAIDHLTAVELLSRTRETERGDPII